MDAPPIVPAGTIEVDGLAVPYYDTKTEYDGQLPVVLVHGSAGTTELHWPFMYPMLATGRRVISLDWQTPTEGPVDVDTIVDQIFAVVDHVLPGREIALLGFSLGATASIAAAAARPEQVRQLIPVAGWMTSDAQQDLFVRVWSDLYETKSPQLVAFTVLNSFGGPFLASLPPGQVDMIISMTQLEPVVATQMALNATVDISDRLDRITATTLVVACTHDQLVPIRHSSQLFGAIEDARYVELDTGHMAVIERPAELLWAIDSFLLNPTAHPAGTTIPTLVP